MSIDCTAYHPEVYDKGMQHYVEMTEEIEKQAEKVINEFLTSIDYRGEMPPLDSGLFFEDQYNCGFNIGVRRSLSCLREMTDDTFSWWDESEFSVDDVKVFSQKATEYLNQYASQKDHIELGYYLSAYAFVKVCAENGYKIMCF